MSAYDSDDDGPTESEFSPTSPNSDKPTQLSRRTHLLKELVDTQLRFANDMMQLQEAMKKVVVRLTSDDRTSLRVNLPDVVSISMKLHRIWNQELQKHESDHVDKAILSSTTTPYLDHINEVFLFYATNYDVDLVQKNADIQEYAIQVVRILREDRPGIVDLNSEMIKPVQRMIKYEQLFAKLKEKTSENHPDYEATCALYDNFRKLVRRANEDKRWNDIRDDVFQEDPRPKNHKTTSKNLVNLLRSLGSTKKKPHTFIKEREFFESVSGFCDLNGNLALHSRIGIRPSAFPLSQEVLKAHVALTDKLITHLLHTTEPRIRRNVLARLEELLLMLCDPDLLLNELDKTEKELIQTQNHLGQGNLKQLLIVTLTDRRNELQNTKETLRANILREIPILIETTEKFLLAVLSYTFTLIADLMNRYSSLMQLEIDKAKRITITDTSMKTYDFNTFIDEINERLGLSGVKRSCSLNLAIINKTKKITHSTINAFTHHHLNVADDSRRSTLTRSSTSLEQFNTLRTKFDRRSPYPPNHKVNRTYSDRVNSSACISPSTSEEPGTAIGFVGINRTGNHQPTSPVEIMNSSTEFFPSHKAIHSYEGNGPNKIKMYAGQHLIVLAKKDASGNEEWWKVKVLPEKTIGYVPANRIKRIL